jgi:hypothetical protein
LERDEFARSLMAELCCELIVFDSQHVDDAGERFDGLLLSSALLV